MIAGIGEAGCGEGCLFTFATGFSSSDSSSLLSSSTAAAALGAGLTAAFGLGACMAAINLLTLAAKV